MTTAYATEQPPLMVPCTLGAPHAFNRPADCPTCRGRGTRPAEDVELVYCDERNHEHELRTDEDPPTLEGLVPLYASDTTGATWECVYRGCTGTINLTRAGA